MVPLRASREQRSPDFMEMSELRAVLPSKKRETQNNNLTVSSTVQYPLATLTCKIREKNERLLLVISQIKPMLLMIQDRFDLYKDAY